MTARRRQGVRLAAGAVAVAGLAACLPAGAGGPAPAPEQGPGGRGHGFERIATFPVFRNNADPSAETVAEIVDASADGKTLVYTDAVLGQVGFLDITDPESPRPGGTVAVTGSPTSVAVADPYVLVAVDTTDDLSAPSGHLTVLDLATRAEVATIPLAGQPDSTEVGPDGHYAAVVIENQRDEDVTVDGEEGGLPQSPGGLLQVVDLRPGGPTQWAVRDVALTGLSDYAPEDPEPEFVDVDDHNRAVVTLQENNHVALVDLATGTVTDDFPAGTVDLDGIDVAEDGVIDPTGSLAEVPREPDAVTWLPGGRLATANEGDLFGGSRGFSVFEDDGTVAYDSGNAVERLAIRHGHYPESRSDAKGTEPEGIEHGRYGQDDLLFVGSERGSFVAVYDIAGARRGHDPEPAFRQLLPTGVGPEGMLAIPGRDLFVVTSESDDPPLGVRTNVSIYRWQRGDTSYPQVVSADAPGGGGAPIPWGALSGLAADPRRPHTVRAVWDSYYAEAAILTLDVGREPAVVRSSTPVTGGSGNWDLEGIAAAPDGTTWLASEGNGTDARPNRLVQVDDHGAVLAEVGLPAEVIACRAASADRGSLGGGFEGVAVEPRPGPDGGGYVLHVAQQRGWDYTTPECEALDDDLADTNPGEPAHTRVWAYDPATGAWSHVAYELEPVPAGAGWVGLSEVTALPDGTFGFIERDNRGGDFAQLKWLARASLDEPVTRATKRHADLLPPLRATNGWVSDKPEGFAVAADGRAYVVTDNDGVEDSSGETQLLRLGPWGPLLG